VEQLQEQIRQLPRSDQLRLVERVSHELRSAAFADPEIMAERLAAMAADPDIQREIRQIEEEFSVAEADGLAAD
jgi:hypothetical protein